MLTRRCFDVLTAGFRTLVAVCAIGVAVAGAQGLGGAGTVQELFALMIFKHQRNSLMEGKPVVIFNREHHTGQRFWDPLIELLNRMCRPGDFVVANTLEELLPGITPAMKRLHAKKQA